MNLITLKLIQVNSKIYIFFLCSLPSVEKFPQENPPLSHHSASMPRPRVPLWHSGPLPPGHCSSSTSSTSPSDRPAVQKPTAGQSSESPTPLRGTRTYSRIYKNINSESAATSVVSFLADFLPHVSELTDTCTFSIFARV